jgi:outer membrane lipoprotein carrier protein
MSSFAFVLLAAAAPTPEIVVQNVKAAYDKAGDIEAAFTQTYFEKLRGKTRTESGHLWATKDGRVRWEYREPVPKYFVFDGKDAFFYEPENAQVTEFEKFEDSDLSNALRFLLGRGDLAKRFEVRACEKGCETTGGELVVALWPREKLPGVDHIHFKVDAKTWRVNESIVFDPLGNRTEYRFSGVIFGAKIPKEMFTFKVPEGVQRLKATIGGPAKKG